MPTQDESREHDWSVAEPLEGIVRVTHVPSDETFEITVADVRGAEPGEDTLRGPLDEYLRKRAINIAARRKLLRRGD
jgi:hypothetical protein